MKIFATFLLLTFAVAFAEDERIVGGEIAEPHSIPHQVAILIQRSAKRATFCGGSLLNTKTILTAGHCLKSTKSALVILGAHNLTATETGVERQLVNASNYRIHPHFNIAYANLDIALIFLPTPVIISGERIPNSSLDDSHVSFEIFSETIQPVNLPTGFLLDESFAGETGTISGFGQFCDACESSQVLRFTENRVLSNDDCSKSFTFSTIPSDTQICLSTAESKSGACRGDCGGPLTILRNGTAVQIGISSFGYKKCEEGKPTVFTRLTRDLIAWINEQIEKEEKKLR